MTKVLSYIQDSLKPFYPPEEIGSFTRLIMEHICGLKPYQLLIEKEKVLPEHERLLIDTVIERLRNREPIQYILGKACFYDMYFRVNPSTLIPRPETEELVDHIIHDCNHKAPLRIVDIGTGSGCIAISLAKHINEAEVTGIDISEQALQTAKENARALEAGNVRFIQIDILNEKEADALLPESLDIIVSNPPYIMESEREAMERNVLDFEPGTALFVPDNDPLLFYRHIARWGKKRILPGGSLYLEINALLGEATLSLLREEGYAPVRLLQDISGRDRFIIARQPTLPNTPNK